MRSDPYHNNYVIGCAIPCYNGGAATLDVIKKCILYVSYVVVVDDSCSFGTGSLISSYFYQFKQVIVIQNPKNMGVGASTKIAFKHLISLNCDVIVKIDADGQMNPDLIPSLIDPIFTLNADVVKGNRFSCPEDISSMPPLRIAGNLALSFMNKLSSGYWELFDPTNGFLAFKASVLLRLRFDKLDNRYFFESDLLFQCALSNVFIHQLAIASIYDGQISSLQPLSEIFSFSKHHLSNFFKRIIYQYFLLDFNAGSLDILGAVFSWFFLVLVAAKTYYNGINFNVYATPGVSGLIVLLGSTFIQTLLAFLYYDSTQQPANRRQSTNYKLR